jgi:hypothetical protein
MVIMPYTRDILDSHGSCYGDDCPLGCGSV